MYEMETASDVAPAFGQGGVEVEVLSDDELDALAEEEAWLQDRLERFGEV